MIHRLQRTQQLPCDLETAWDFFSSPNNLSKITPKEMKFTVLTDLTDKDIYEGMVIEYTVSPLFGIPLKWRTVIQEVNDRKYFVDFQEKGPYKLWRHRHDFTANAEGVLMKDTVDYELPFGVLGDFTHWLLVGKKVRQIFDHRYEVLDKYFKSDQNS